MSIRIASFTGEIPRLIPRLLPDSAAQAAENVKLDSGGLRPIRRARHEHRLTEDAQLTIHRLGDDWLSWPVPVNVVPGPIAQDRLYVTGDGPPKLIAEGDSYDLAVPHPPSAPTLALVSGSVDPALQQSILYAYTWVTEFDEESEPSPVSAPLLWSPGLSIEVSGFTAHPTDRAIDRMRVYRSQTSALGETSLFFVTERPVSTADYIDNVSANPIGEVLPSLDYNAPPAGLSGLIALPNGMMAAFAGKRLYFSEPYRPHAWPEKYVLTVDFPIVGLGAFGSSIAVLTEGQPYLVQGTSPDSMAMAKLEVKLPCVSARGIADMGYAVAYPSPDGLVVISESGANVVSRNLITRDDWRRLNPYALVAAPFDGRYIASYRYTDATETERRGMLLIDLTGQQPFLTRGGDDADAYFVDDQAGALFILKNGRDIYEWDAISEPFGDLYWRSKRFVFQGDTNMGAILIEGEGALTPEQRAASTARAEAIRAANEALIDGLDGDGALAVPPLGTVTFAGSLLAPVEAFEDAFLVRVYADGRHVADVADLNRVVRLPGGFLAKTWEIEVRGNQLITAIAIGKSPSELAQ